MCGIVGYAGKREAAAVVLEGLKRLEYRGYDSAGLAVVSNGAVELRRCLGKIEKLVEAVKSRPVSGTIAISHTRWATHGRPSEENAHPHADCQGRIALVHNGIIENHATLKRRLMERGHRFGSETDTEVLAHLVEEHNRGDMFAALRAALSEVRGAYALAVISRDEPDRLLGARKDCPLILGLGEEENFLASDIPALLPYTRRVIVLEEGEIAEVRKDGVRVWDGEGRERPASELARRTFTVPWDPVLAEKAPYRHFMEKEIREQPRVVQDTLRGRISLESGEVFDEEMKITDEDWRKFSRVHLIACGTAYHAALVGKFLLENWAGIPAEADIASEFRYRSPRVGPSDLVIPISQSGETADTIAGLRLAKKSGARIVSVCNTLGSTIARESDGVFFTRCGPEIAVASTKAFIGQLVGLYLLALTAARARSALKAEEVRRRLQDLAELPRHISEAMDCEEEVKDLARSFRRRAHALYLGRHVNYPIALEGALKLKEISYIHAEGYPAGEMKHGPIALIDENMPVVVIATPSSVRDKILANMEEARARAGIVIAVAAKEDAEVRSRAEEVIPVPAVDEWLSPAVNVIPLQLLAYHVAVIRGCDVDQPRNLAKSVTVE